MGSFRLEYEGEEGREFSFDGSSITVGRGRSSDFVLDHPTVSRQHAVVVDDGGGAFRLVVLSEGGLTAVDGDRVRGEVELYDGSRIHFGELAFRFRSPEAPAEPAPAVSADGNDGGRPGPNSAARREPAETGARSTPESSTSDSLAGPGSGGAAEIESWDEIAESAADSSSTAASSGRSDEGADRLSSSAGESVSDDREEEQTDPLLVSVALLLSAGLLAVAFWPGEEGGGVASSGEEATEETPMKIQVDCLSDEECMSEARRVHRVGTEYLEKQDAEIGNLFKGYKRLLETRAYLEKAGRSTPPEEMADLEGEIEKAAGELDRIFRNYRVKYKSAAKNDRHRDMARALHTIQQYFPDKTSREYRWARDRIFEMKDNGTYPAGMGAEF